MKNSPLKWILIGVGVILLLILGIWLVRRLTAPRPVAEVTASPGITAAAALATPEAPTPLPTVAQPLGPVRVKYQSGDQYLIVEFLDEDLVHFELSAFGPGGDVDQPIYTTPMIARTEFPGPLIFKDDGQGTLETGEIKVQVDTDNLCATVTDKSKDPDLILTTACPWNLEKDFKGLTLTPESFTHAYGLGEIFIEPGLADGDWIGRSRFPGDYGNVQEPFNNGNVGNDQFPILYLAGEGLDSYALFLDSPYKQFWTFEDEPWKTTMQGKWVRFFVLTGKDLQDLRQDFMELVGKPLVPPKQAFGMWVSEYGYDNWAELEDKLRTLRENHFPVDGFVLDLQWYGGIQEKSDDTHMGSLTWDEQNFPDPEGKIAALRDEQGVGIIAIEQPYIGKNLPVYSDLQDKGYLVRDGCPDCDPVYLTENPWWGMGGMLDFSNSEGTAYWHDTKRQPLIDAGVIGHWTDLGEPELYNPDGWYWGIPGDYEELHAHPDVHNLYNLLWSQSIYDGYQRNEVEQRPFILSRSGTAGIQRYGAALWSGDISGLLSSLAAHFNVQMHMSMSGVDFYGADIGGFFRQGEDPIQMYTQWFANGMAFDVPARVHTFNLCNCQETAPDRIGDAGSNLRNLRQRYELSPYLYSLAHLAYLNGEPVVPPLVYYYQADPNVREMGSQKMIGRDLLVAAIASPNITESKVYLPAGTWVDYHTGEWIESQGEWIGPIPLFPDGYFTLPMYARAGAIIPQMYVDDQTMNVLGQRLDDSQRDELVLRVFAGDQPTEFTLYEDDGRTIAYQDGQVRQTVIAQHPDDDKMEVVITESEGSYDGAPDERDNVVKLQVNGLMAGKVLLNNEELPEFETQAELDGAPSGWFNAGGGLIIARSGVLPVSLAKTFQFELVEAVASESSGQPLEPLAAYWPTKGWQKAVPEQVGMDSTQLVKALDFLQRRGLNLQHFTLIRNGYLTLDAPFYSTTGDAPYERDAVARSFLSTLVGIAIDQGYIESLDQPVLDFFPEREIQNLDEQKKAISVGHLLTMTAGLPCKTDPEGSLTYAWEQEQDWEQSILDQPVLQAPGTKWEYCPPLMHLVSAIIQKSTGMSALQYAQENLFTPLGIGEVTWETDPRGVNIGWRGLRMHPADVAKLGWLYLNNGKWEDQQVIPAEWVSASTTSQVEGQQFGYQWFLDPAGYLNWDFPGQWLIVIPEQNVVAVLSGSIPESESWIIRILLQSLVFPAIQSDTTLPANPEGAALLDEKVAELGQGPEPQPVPPLPETAGRISGREITLEESEIGWKSLKLDFPAGSEAQLSVDDGVQPFILPVGLDNIPRAITYGQPEIGDGIIVASRGSWVEPDVFSISLDQENVYFHMPASITFTFDEDAVTVVLEAPGEGKFAVPGVLEPRPQPQPASS